MTSSEIPLNQIKLPDNYKPSEDEEFMNPMQLAYFRKKLLDWKNELLSGASDTILGLSEETLQKPDAADRARPIASLSLDAQEKHERMEKIHRED